MPFEQSEAAREAKRRARQHGGVAWTHQCGDWEVSMLAVYKEGRVQGRSFMLLDMGGKNGAQLYEYITGSNEAWDEIFVEMNNQTEGIHGWKTGYEPLDDMLDGIARPGKGGVAYGLAGAPQHGKSAAMLNIGLQVALNNTDASILYWAIDDNRKAIAYRLTSMISEVTMKKVRNIHPSSDDEKKRIRDAQDLLMTLTSEKRLIFKDDRFGRSTAKAEKWIQEVQDSEGRDVLFCVDSLHNIQSPIEGDQRVKLIANSTWLKGLCAKMPLSAMATMELVKNRGDIKPTLTSISESGKMEFDFDAVAITWMEAQGKYEAVANAYAKWGEAPFYKPIIELDWQKNKSAAGEKGPVYFKYEPTTTKFVDCTSKLDGLVVSSPVVIRDGDSKLSVSSSRDGGLVPTKPRRFVLGDR